MISPTTSIADSGKFKRYSPKRVIAVTALFILAVVTATSVMLTASYRDTVRQEKRNLRNVSVAFAAQTLTTTRVIDHVLSELQNDYLRASDGRASQVKLLHLARTNPGQDFLLGAYLFEEDGRLIASTGANESSLAAKHYANRLKLSALNSRLPFKVEVTDIDPQTGYAVLCFSRPLFDASGHKAGVILARADARYFQSVYNSVTLGEGGSVTLLNLDGTMLVRGPSLPTAIGRSFRETPLFKRYLPAAGHGSFEAASPIDGIERIYGFDMVVGYPLLIITGMDKSYALSLWFERLHFSVIFLGIIVSIVIFLAWRVARESRTQAAFIDKLAAGEIRLTKSAEYLKQILNTIGNPMWVLDSQRRFVLINDAFSRFVGRRQEELIGRHESEAIDIEGAAERERTHEKILRGLGNIETETDIVDATGEKRRVIKLASKLVNEEGSSQIVSVLTDITDRKKAEVRLAYIADFDPLTELPNQSHFRRVLQAQVSESGFRREQLGVLVVSLDRLQEIIELMDHEAGDEALKQASDRLRPFLANSCCIARVKSNEFAVLIRLAPNPNLLQPFADELHASLSAPFSICGREFYLGPFIGISLFPQDGTTADELFRSADLAKHRASTEGKDPIHFFSEATHAILNERLTIEGQLRRALERQEFRVVYQPKVEISSGRIVGFEALLRWSNPVLGSVSPARFIPIAETTGLIVPIGAWVLHEACSHASSWSRQFGTTVKVAVNLSLRQFHQRDLLPLIKRSVEACGISPDCLELEITESTVMSRAHEVDALMREIRALGVTMSIDDFGTGYSSLAYLKRFPVQRLKIDRAFIGDLGRDEDSAAIVKSIINLGHGLKLRVVAEGVETEEQLAFLTELSCDEYQGFLFSRPVEAAAVPALLNQNWLTV
jgi:diguanylate cyclase (GGDEF)-like protein/PAS domain S-box-containing protein